MGFFKDFKEDFSEAVDELIPVGSTDASAENESKNNVTPETPAADTLETDIDLDQELSKLDGLLEQVTKRVDDEKESSMPPVPSAFEERVAREAREVAKELNKMDTSSKAGNMMTQTQNVAPVNVRPQSAPIAQQEAAAPASDENAVITNGMRIIGDLESTGSIQVEGTINGNVKCNGKLTVTGIINGNSTSSEFFADSAKIEGEVLSSGTVKVGVGSVIIGNIAATSAVIAGAVKGDIDVQGPVVVDTSAVVMGNIKSRSVQINQGAVIEGFCSQTYAEVDVESVFA